MLLFFYIQSQNIGFLTLHASLSFYSIRDSVSIIEIHDVSIHLFHNSKVTYFTTNSHGFYNCHFKSCLNFVKTSISCLNLFL